MRAQVRREPEVARYWQILVHGRRRRDSSGVARTPSIGRVRIVVAATLVAVVHNTSTAARNMIVAIGGKRLQFSVPANGFATVNPQ